MNILHVLDFEPPFGGGIVQLLRALGHALARDGDHLVAAFPSSQVWFSDLADACEPVVVPEIKRPLRSGFAQAYGQLVLSRSIDLAHVSFSFALPVALACGRRASPVPLLYHWHNPPAVLHGGPLAPGQRKIPPIVARWIARLADERAIRLHLAVSTEIREGLLRAGWTAPDRVEVLFNALAPGEFRAPRRDSEPATPSGNPQKKSPVIGTIANFRPQKDHATLLHAFAGVLERSPEAKLVIVGDGPTRPEIERIIAKLAIADHVEFTGFVNDVTAQLDRFDVFALATHYEGHCIVQLEAMARGLPVVATDLPTVREAAGPDLNGLLVPPSDPAAMTNALHALLADPALRERYGRLGRERVEREFDLDRWCRRLIAIYRRELST